MEADSLPLEPPSKQATKPSKVKRDKKGLKNTKDLWDFPCSPVVKTLHCHCRGNGFDPFSGNKDSTCQTVQPKTGGKNTKHFSERD